ATWLQEHIGVEIIVRDRAEAYAEGATQGSPTAQQVADRFHLVQNASEAMEELLRGHRRSIERAEEHDESRGEYQPTAKPASRRAQERQEQRARRVGRW